MDPNVNEFSKHLLKDPEEPIGKKLQSFLTRAKFKYVTINYGGQNMFLFKNLITKREKMLGFLNRLIILISFFVLVFLINVAGITDKKNKGPDDKIKPVTYLAEINAGITPPCSQSISVVPNQSQALISSPTAPFTPFIFRGLVTDINNPLIIKSSPVSYSPSSVDLPTSPSIPTSAYFKTMRGPNGSCPNVAELPEELVNAINLASEATFGAGGRIPQSIIKKVSVDFDESKVVPYSVYGGKDETFNSQFYNNGSVAFNSVNRLNCVYEVHVPIDSKYFHFIYNRGESTSLVVELNNIAGDNLRRYTDTGDTGNKFYPNEVMELSTPSVRGSAAILQSIGAEAGRLLVTGGIYIPVTVVGHGSAATLIIKSVDPRIPVVQLDIERVSSVAKDDSGNIIPVAGFYVSTTGVRGALERVLAQKNKPIVYLGFNTTNHQWPDMVGTVVKRLAQTSLLITAAGDDNKDLDRRIILK